MKSHQSFYTILVSSLFVLPIFVGCTEPGSLSGVYPCEGTVTYQGVPLAGATITFHPIDGGEDARPAGASTDANGRFKTTTLKPEDGLFPGNYKVTVIKTEETGEVRTFVDDDGELQEVRPRHNVLPARYASPESTDLTVTVEKRRNTLTIELGE